jgi:hypothetical protein
MEEEEIKLNENELRVQALLESLGELTQKYEQRVANLRIEITMLQKENRDLMAVSESKDQEILELRSQLGTDANETIEGEVVQEED